MPNVDPFPLGTGNGVLNWVVHPFAIKEQTLSSSLGGGGVDGPSAGETEPPITPVVIAREAWS